jgi:uncharacterized protein YbjT (DUF2867 family)
MHKLEALKGNQIMYAVFGASGRAGGETAKALLAKGEAVRVVLRRPDQLKAWEARGASVVLANMEDADAIASALNGVTGAFLLSPPPISGDPFRSANVVATALAAGARNAGLRKAVVLSSIGAQHATGTGVIATLHQMETLLANVAPATAFLRPGYYVETWSEVVGAVLGDGTLPTFTEPDLKMPMVSTIDVGSAAASLLCDEWSGQRVVELGGPDDWTARDVAEAFSSVLGSPVHPLFVPVSEQPSVYAQAGVPKEIADALLGMYQGISNRRIAREGDREEWRGATSLLIAVERIVANAKIGGPS